MTVYPFQIDVPQTTLDDLRARLERTRWPDEIAHSGWDYGANLAYLQRLIAYWLDGFDWRVQEAALNRFHHVRAVVDGVGLHCILEPGAGQDPMPLLLLHGWPSSFVQMLDLIPRLVAPTLHGGDAADAFDVVAVSLPGYGFSDIPTTRGMSVSRIATLVHRLMTQVLGYERYSARGSDLGAGVITQLALTHPDALIGVHLSGTNPFVMDVPDNLTPEEEMFAANARHWMQTEMAYAMEHASKPQTLAYGLNDSPAGLAAWILEKFWRWCDHHGDLDETFGKDQLLSNLTIYWVTGTINASMRLYYETMRNPGVWGRVEVPSAYLMSDKDMFPTPREWVERTARVDRWTEIDQGGHFLEWEVPEIVADDLRAFFCGLRQGARRKEAAW
jgi:pimeloyl-ACP methyl ester carboxylesterase